MRARQIDRPEAGRTFRQLPREPFRRFSRTAAKYPVGAAGRGGAFGRLNGGWGVIRRRDGTVIKQ